MAQTTVASHPRGAPPIASQLFRLAALCALVALELDWATKTWAMAGLQHDTLSYGVLALGVEHNAAFAFSTGAGLVSRELVAVVRLAAIAAVVLLAGAMGLRERRQAAGLGLIVGGGLGNAGDLLFRAHGVVDFIGAGPFPLQFWGVDREFGVVFNTADVAVLVGVFLLAPVIRFWALAARARLRSRKEHWVPDES